MGGFLLVAAGIGAWVYFSKTSRAMWFRSGVATELQTTYGLPSNIADSLVQLHRDYIDQQRRLGASKGMVALQLSVATAFEDDAQAMENDVEAIRRGILTGRTQ